MGSSSGPSGPLPLHSGSPVDLGLCGRCEREGSGKLEIRTWEQLRVEAEPPTPLAAPAMFPWLPEWD